MHFKLVYHEFFNHTITTENILVDKGMQTAGREGQIGYKFCVRRWIVISL